MEPNPPPPAAGWPDRAVGAIADRQRTMICAEQILALGVSRATIERAIARGRLHRVHYGVYSLMGPRARPPFAAEQAALLACGPHAALSHHSAAAVHGLRLPVRSTEIHLTTGGPHRRARRGLVVHRTIDLPRAEPHRVNGLIATSVARTLIDLAPLLSDRQLAPLVDQALRRVSRARLLAAVQRHRRRPRTTRLARVLDPRRPSAETWSRAEARLLAAIRRAGLPTPEANQAIGRYVADLLWRQQRVIVEYDSEAFHSGPGVFHNDRARHNDLTSHGDYEVLHVTEQHLLHEPERVVVWVALALQRRGGW